MIGLFTASSECGDCRCYNSHMRKPLFAVALVIAMAAAIVVYEKYAVEPWLNVWMPVCGVSDWRDFKSCMAQHGVHVDDRNLFVHTARQEKKGVQPTPDGTNGIPGKKQ